MKGYKKRGVDRLIRELISELPALLIVGPRAAGKTTTATRHAATVVRLDHPGEAAAFRADPDAALRGLEEPVLLDEWQAVPEVLGAVKRAVDKDSRPGRFLLTGSVRTDLDASMWPGTGRLVRVPLFGMTVAEQLGRETPSLLDRLARSDRLRAPRKAPDLRDYVDLALRGGFPEAALALSRKARVRWIESYAEQLLSRDAARTDGPRDPGKLRRYFEAYALNSAGVANDKTIYEAAGVNHRTAASYEQLLVDLAVIERVPPWSSNRLKRLIRSPKRYLIDPALLAGSLRLDAAGVLRDGDILGRILDTFVAAQLRAGLAAAESRPRLYHLRQEDGRREIDLLAELAGGGIIGIEVKADAAPRPKAAAHLRWLRDKLGERFLAGAVLHTGPGVYELDERILAVPICVLWN